MWFIPYTESAVVPVRCKSYRIFDEKKGLHGDMRPAQHHAGLLPGGEEGAHQGTVGR